MICRNLSGEQKSLSGALQIEIGSGDVITAVGAGGKTSLLFAWAKELTAAGLRTVITTTTHMERPRRTEGQIQTPLRYRGVPFADAEETGAGEKVRRYLAEDGIVYTAAPDPKNDYKVVMPSREYLSFLEEEADVVLIEGDGSRRRPLKWPAPWEPVILPETTVTVCVAGLSCLGQRAADAVYRPEDMVAFLGTSREEAQSGHWPIREETLIEVLSAPEGGKKGACGAFRIWLNQADTPAAEASAVRILESLKRRGIAGAWGRREP